MFQKTFTDNHGITHTDAVVMIESCNVNQSENYGEDETVMSSHNNVNYSYRYWTNLAAKNSGASALSGNENINDVENPQGARNLQTWAEEDLSAKLA